MQIKHLQKNVPIQKKEQKLYFIYTLVWMYINIIC